VFTISQKYIFNFHQITTSGGKINSFSCKDTDKSTAQNAPKHTISSKKFIFFLGNSNFTKTTHLACSVTFWAFAYLE